MKLPFSKQQFLEVFRQYNTTFFPLQILLCLLAAFVIFSSLKMNRSSGKSITFILSFFWLWMGAVYHIAFFSSINKVAYVFGVMFLVQGIILFNYAYKAPMFTFRKDLASLSSTVLLIYALAVYPLLSYIGGHGYPYSPTFGLPCPTTIFTLAIFLISEHKLPFYLILIPLLWTVIGFSAAFTLGIYEDIGLIVSGLVLVILNSIKSKKLQVENQS